MKPELEVVIGAHFYQPPRRAAHQNLRDISTDPQGINWTEIITGECYSPLARLGIYRKISYDFYGTLDRALEDIDPETAQAMRIPMRENGVADVDIHLLLPDLTLV